MPSVLVQRYSGGCLETPAKARAVAAGHVDLRGRGNRVVAVVSAMGMTAIVDGFAMSPALHSERSHLPGPVLADTVAKVENRRP